MTIPSSTPALYLHSTERSVLFSADDVVLFNEDKMEEVPVVFESQASNAAIIRPVALEDATRYTLALGSGTAPCLWSKSDVFYTFQTGEASSLPETALNLKVVSATHEDVYLPGASVPGACGELYDGARLVLQADVPEALQPWRPMLLWHTLIDGKRHDLQSTTNGQVVLEAACDWFAPDAAQYMIGEGVFDVQMVANLVGTQTQWSSQVMTVRVSCSEGPWSGHGDVGGGCGCVHVDHKKPHGVGIVLFLAGLFLWRRQREV